MTNITDIRHPDYESKISDWNKYRITFEGGSKFIRTFLKKYSRYEEEQDFRDRLAITYNPGTAAAAIGVIKNSVFQRLTDVLRKGGDATYQTAVATKIDLENHNLNCFIGTEILPDLLSIGKIYVKVDAPILVNEPSLEDARDKSPYLYTYPAEDVLSWSEGEYGKLEALLVRNRVMDIDITTGLTSGKVCQYLLYKLTNKVVSITTYDEGGVQIGQPSILDIDEIPIVCIKLEDSLLKDVADHQISALQLASSDMNSLFRNGFPLYTEQYDPRAVSNLRGPGQPQQPVSFGTGSGTVESRTTRALEDAPTSNSDNPKVFAGAGKGRAYPKDTERPGFIAPPTAPVEASIAKQKIMAAEVRELVNLALSSMASSYASGESKKQDQVGLESGLSYIGLILEHAENEIARLWAKYIGDTTPAVIKYPKTYSLKSEEQRLAEAKSYKDLQGAVPSQIYSKSVSKKIAHTLLAGLVDQDLLEDIYQEIDTAPGISGDPEQISSDIEAGIVSTKTACVLRGYDEGEAEAAAHDHAERAARIVAAQSVAGGHSTVNDPVTMKNQKKSTKDATLDDKPGDKVRGKGK